MCHLHCCGMRLEMIVDPSREDGRFHSHCPWLGKRLHPQVQSQSRGGYRAFCVDTATAVLHAVVDRFLVNIQTDVVHSLHGGASLVVSESARSLSSAFLHQALLHDSFIQTIRQQKPLFLAEFLLETMCQICACRPGERGAGRAIVKSRALGSERGGLS